MTDHTSSTKPSGKEPDWKALTAKVANLEMALAVFLNAAPRPNGDDSYMAFWNSMGAALDLIGDARTIAALAGNTKDAI